MGRRPNVELTDPVKWVQREWRLDRSLKGGQKQHLLAIAEQMLQECDERGYGLHLRLMMAKVLRLHRWSVEHQDGMTLGRALGEEMRLLTRLGMFQKGGAGGLRQVSPTLWEKHAPIARVVKRQTQDEAGEPGDTEGNSAAEAADESDDHAA